MFTDSFLNTHQPDSMAYGYLVTDDKYVATYKIFVVTAHSDKRIKKIEQCDMGVLPRERVFSSKS